MSKPFKEFIVAIQAASLDVDSVMSDLMYEDGSALADLGYTGSVVDHHGGEGQGDEYWTVWKIEKDGNVFHVQVEGWYASYDGSTYTGYYEVEPVEVTVTQYRLV